VTAGGFHNEVLPPFVSRRVQSAQLGEIMLLRGFMFVHGDNITRVGVFLQKK
jgi:hypothetical protein